MRLILYILILAVSFSACRKNQVSSKELPPPDPLPTKIITTDTLTTGQWWGLNIGDTITEIYKTIQHIQAEKRINYLAIVGNVFTNIEDVRNTIPLYTTIFLDEKAGTESGIQIYFAHDKVNAIWTNSGTLLGRWPPNADLSATIAKDEAIGNIYSTLNSISHIAAFANKFERISLFNKDIGKAYDPQMSKSPQWHFSATVNNSRFYIIHLNFSSGLLASVYATLCEIP